MPFPSVPLFVAGAQSTADYNAYIHDTIKWLGGDGTFSKPIWRVRSSVPVAMGTFVGWNTISFNTVDIGKGPAGLEWFDIADPTHLLITMDCIARIDADGQWPNVISNKAIRIILNDDGTKPLCEQDDVGVSTPAANRAHCGTIWKFTAGDVITMQMYQDSGGTINSVPEGYSTPVMCAEWIGLLA